MLWRTILALLAFIIVMGTIGLIWKWKAKKGTANEEQVKTMENVVDLNDKFNRARYMSQDKG